MTTICINFLSDIHLEFYEKFVDFELIPCVKKVIDSINSEQVNILLLAGDIGYPTDLIYKEFLYFVSAFFDHVLLIKGNHEYYCEIENEKIDDLIQSVCENTNIIFLNNSSWCYNGKIRFLGTTLWSNINRIGYRCLNDKEYCYDSLDEAIELHNDSVKWLESSINQYSDSDIPCIVLTHHLPSNECIHPKYQLWTDINTAFASDLEYLMKKPIKAWFFGHTHLPCQARINGVYLACNPSGYPDELNSCSDYKSYIIDV